MGGGSDMGLPPDVGSEELPPNAGQSPTPEIVPENPIA